MHLNALAIKFTVAIVSKFLSLIVGGLYRLL